MDWYSIVFEMIDMRSFRNLWFWIALAVMWSFASHYVLGVPWDMVIRARKNRAEAMDDLSALSAIHVRRILNISHESGLMLTGAICFVLTSALILGWGYGRDFAQALFLLLLPMSLVWLLSVRAASIISAKDLTGEALIVRLSRHRHLVQLIGMVSIFVTAMWGMYKNMITSALGG